MIRLLCLFVVAAWTLAGLSAVSPFAQDSLEFELAATFSRIEQKGDEGLELVVLDRFSGFKCLSLASQEERHLKGGAVAALSMGDHFRFELVEHAYGYLDLALTNDVGRLFAQERAQEGKARALYVLVHVQRTLRTRTRFSASRFELQDWQYVIDVAGGRYYDETRKKYGKISFPFRAPWKNWRDYYTNFTGRTRVDMKEFICGLGLELRTCMDGTPAFFEFVRGQPVGEPRIVCSQVPGHVLVTNLVMVCNNGATGTVLAAARRGIGDVMCVCGYDSEGRVRWYASRSRESKLANEVELSPAGEVVRHLEFEGDGRDVEPEFRWYKNLEMVPPDDRPAFRAEVEKLVRPFEDAWRDRTYTYIPALPPKPAIDPHIERLLPAARAQREKLYADDEARWSLTNTLRRTAGLPPLTEWDRKCITQAEAMERIRKDFERWRLRTTGAAATNAEGARVDLERARLWRLRGIVEHEYKLGKRGKADHPKTLEELLTTTWGVGGDRHALAVEADLRDVWGRAYRYQYRLDAPAPVNMVRAILVSAGPDGVFDTPDDLSSDDIYFLRKFQREQGL